ncbi:MAG: MoaD family protein [Coriobacteriales bacterium]|jgi:molybdopterin synthase sulfur carrier subunit|nr:MoaD family protein [Coriobacteriales bacterium]
MQVKLFATYRTITGRSQLELAAPDNVLELLHQLSNEYGSELRSWLLSPDGTAKGDNAIVLVNGRHIEHLDGVATKLSEADKISLFPLVAGG